MSIMSKTGINPDRFIFQDSDGHRCSAVALHLTGPEMSYDIWVTLVVRGMRDALSPTIKTVFTLHSSSSYAYPFFLFDTPRLH